MIEQLKTIREALNECPNNVVKAHIALAQLEAMVGENKRLREALKAILDEQDANQGHATLETYDAARAALESKP